ncbi:protein kinase family protein [Bacteroides reticulotermitis]|uniref:Protein kinase domain-containing protein n=2 Tax=Bacteroides reticulotermitis TaxID=1133319 RepID=W4UUT9_9BACE|nr:protein kinase family protein [Bacteroides reticulotermitis]MBB4043103.1 serine/threonine-protein kinase [Bacteroides reticulotermitis]GAE84383.1 hypothetical protein JCM10512_2718 [Bacteroides reticulotermitis JCM 10512]
METKDTVTFLRSKDFVMLKDIGQGGTGQTKLLKDETINEQFVCKKYSTYYPDQQSLYYDNFVNEIKLLYKINHPNIVRIFNYYLYPERVTGYILMEYIDGEDIEAYISSNPGEVNNIFLQTINGFKYLEENNILHRDIRPNNILVSNDRVVKIIDFGFGKNIASLEDNQKSITLNWAYSLPNEFNDSIYDFKTEIYFVGKLFERIIQINNLHKLFKYKSILNKMTTPESDSRIASFYTIFREVTSKNSTFIKFSSNEKQIYSNIANSIMTVCSTIEYSTKYLDDIEIITKRLDDLINKSLLEDYVQNNSSLINCFIADPYSYKKSPVIPIEYIVSFSDWWKGISNEYKIIVLNNLWERFDTIKRMSDNLPF